MKDVHHAGTTASPTVIVLLAAGSGSRFEHPRHKLLAELTISAPGGQRRRRSTVFAEALRHAVDASIGPVIVVTGALSAAELLPDSVISDSVIDETVEFTDDVQFVHNPRWDHGQSTSLQAGISAARSLGAERVVVGLADQPGIDPIAWQNVAVGLGPITVATYDGRRGNPVMLHTDVWSLLPTDGDEGARIVMRARPDLVLEVPCPGSPADIDTVKDLHAWQNN